MKGKAVAMNKVFHFDAPREKYHLRRGGSLVLRQSL